MDDDTPRALSHPLPAGMRDLLPEETRQRRALARRLLDHFALHGYDLVTPPAFELAEVLERGLGAQGPADVLRFVEPESGEIAALRPDMTPQIARMVATRLAREPLPIRLCYEGTIVRRRQGRARRRRQVAQAGVELYGLASRDGDLEVLRLAAAALRATGLERFVLDVGHAGIGRALLDAVPIEHAGPITDALTLKDRGAVEQHAAKASLSRPIAEALAALPDLHGGGPDDPGAARVLERARRVFAGTPAERALSEVEALWRAASSGDGELAGVLRLDLGELRGFAYYTGMIFHVLAEGPGEPIGAGGRYDELLARFDAPMPAVGFALSLDALAWARERADVADEAPARVVVALGEGGAAIAAALRARGVAAVVHAEGDAERFARAWRWSHVLARRGGILILAAPGGAGTAIGGGGAEDAAAEVARRLAEGAAR